MLIVKSYSVPKISCFTYILFVAASALYNIYNAGLSLEGSLGEIVSLSWLTSHFELREK